MASLTLTKRIEAPVEAVFAVASDLARAAEHFRGIQKIELLTPEPVGVGTRWRETRTMMGRESTETLEITDFQPPHRYTVGCHSCGAYFETTFRFQPASSGATAGGSASAAAGLSSSASLGGSDSNQSAATDVTLDVRCQARSLMAKLMSPLTNMMFGKMMRTCMEEDLDDLKRVAEAQSAAVT